MSLRTRLLAYSALLSITVGSFTVAAADAGHDRTDSAGVHSAEDGDGLIWD
ncbi:hypothetical protein [Streptomyces sp. NPDC087294]|uniref:hypothetical protein n=1 Tax=Streptomyces sp. NPDC087294 TaxID=3365777 RepID=UPI0038238357